MLSIGRVVALFVLYVVAARAGLSLAAVNPSATAVWPPTGIAMAACLLLGRRAWPAIFAGAFVANLTNAGSVATSIGIAVGNTLEGILGAYFIRRFSGATRRFDRVADVFLFAMLAGCVATCVSATIGVTTLAIGGYASWSMYWPIWVTWWLGDASGALIFAPLIIILDQDREPVPTEQRVELCAFALVLLADAMFVFGGLYEPTRHYPLAFLSIPPILWAAFRLGARATSAGIAVLSLIAAWNTHRGIGPFAVGGIASLVVLQAFMATVAITAMAIAALVTERRRVEAARLALLDAERSARADSEAAGRAKDEFLAMLGHELRNPIAAIKVAVHVLGRSGPGGEGDRARDVIRRQADHLTRLVDDLLDATRIATGKLTLNRQIVDLASVASRAVGALTAAGGSTDRELKIDLAPVWVDGDATRLEQVITNLVGNALKYTPAGRSVHVTVQAQKGAAVLTVADTGTGIPRDLIPRVFDLFTQGPRELDRSQGGLGIGLTLVKRVVELHGGDVAVRSDGEGQGSTFTVRLAAVPAPSRFADAKIGARMPSAPAANRRVLVVEDQSDMREILRFALEDAGHVVFEAADGPAAIAAVERYEPDVALIDIGLPGFDGYEVARRIRSIRSAAPMLLVAVTGYGQPDDRRRSSAAGFDVHLVKPIDVERLHALITGAGEMKPEEAGPTRGVQTADS
jgi:signal transduction histidine kinase/ActR/RegA family two-component response regulator